MYVDRLTDEELDFVQYLIETLVPDLKESGNEETAKDFERCIDLIQSLRVRVP
jgi:hypothetical protein